MKLYSAILSSALFASAKGSRSSDERHAEPQGQGQPPAKFAVSKTTHRQLKQECLKDLNDNENKHGSTLLTQVLFGKSFVVNDDPYVYSMKIVPAEGKFIQERTGVGSWDLGKFVRFEEGGDNANDVAIFENGDYCSPIGAGRSATVEFVEDCEATELTFISVEETTTCVYDFVLSGLCICPED